MRSGKAISTMTTMAKPAMSADRCDTARSISAFSSTLRRASSMDRRSLSMARCCMSSWRHLTCQAMSAPWISVRAMARRACRARLRRATCDASLGAARRAVPSVLCRSKKGQVGALLKA